MTPSSISAYAQPVIAASRPIAARAGRQLKGFEPGMASGSVGPPLGQLDAGVFWVGPVKDHGMTHQSAERCTALLGDRLSRCLLVLGRQQTNLDEFVGEQCFVERAQNLIAHARLADVDDWAQRVRKPAERLALMTREYRSGS